MNKIQLIDTHSPTATKDLRDKEIFKRMKINFWCADITPTSDKINAAMENLPLQKNINREEIKDLDLDLLIDKMTLTYHQSTRDKAVIIYDLAQKVAYRHREAHPELAELVTAMFFFLQDLLRHMMREEQILFPNIKQLLKNKSRSQKGTYTSFGLIKEWVGLMQKEHESAYKSFKLFNELTNKYTVPEDACSLHISLFRLMKKFEADFSVLVGIENNILFTKAVLEDEVCD
jgi:regulator of cell morphogenesis and NO signaling